MKVIKTKIKGPLIIQKETFSDKRGYLREIYKEKIISKKFVFEILSKSKKMLLEDYTFKKTPKVNM